MDILLILYEYSSDFLHYIIFVPPSLEATRCCNYERAPLIDRAIFSRTNILTSSR